jgi:hypothetical protein
MQRTLTLFLCCALVPVAALSAQGALSTQGMGYPEGEMSTRALGTGGAISEFDGRSPLNPAALAIGGLGQVYGQYDPEIRTVTGPSGSSRTVTSRFSNFGAILPINQRLFMGFSVASFLDRTWATTATREQPIGEQPVSSTEILKSQGGISDLRFGLAYAITPRFRLGVAGHYYTGSNQVNLLQQFPDSLSFGNVSQTSSLNFEGNAVSAGFEIDLLPSLGFAVSGRKGGTLEMSAGDTLLTKAHIPDHYAASLSYDGIPGTIVAARFAQDKWSSLTPLSTSGEKAVDANEFNVGLESAGPRAWNRAIIIRLGTRWRTLPFQASGNDVREFSFGGGLGIPISREHAAIDIAVLRSNRTGVSGITEHAYNLSFGLRVQP